MSFHTFVSDISQFLFGYLLIVNVYMHSVGDSKHLIRWL